MISETEPDQNTGLAMSKSVMQVINIEVERIQTATKWRTI